MTSRVGQLVQGLSSYRGSVSSHYDEVLAAVSASVDEAGSVGKADIGALVLWKRISASTVWAARLNAMSDEEVREHTGRAVAAVRDRGLSNADAAGAGRAALSPVPGFKSGDALASAVLVAAAPRRMAVYDRRAQAGLERLGLVLSSARGRYARYMGVIDALVAEAAADGEVLSPREVDMALYWIGGSEKS